MQKEQQCSNIGKAQDTSNKVKLNDVKLSCCNAQMIFPSVAIKGFKAFVKFDFLALLCLLLTGELFILREGPSYQIG